MLTEQEKAIVKILHGITHDLRPDVPAIQIGGYLAQIKPYLQGSEKVLSEQEFRVLVEDSMYEDTSSFVRAYIGKGIPKLFLAIQPHLQGEFPSEKIKDILLIEMPFGPDDRNERADLITKKLERLCNGPCPTCGRSEEVPNLTSAINDIPDPCPTCTSQGLTEKVSETHRKWRKACGEERAALKQHTFERSDGLKYPEQRKKQRRKDQEVFSGACYPDGEEIITFSYNDSDFMPDRRVGKERRGC